LNEDEKEAIANDIEFIILHSKYLVIRESKDIYFLDMTDNDSEFTKVNLKLREGIIS
jgi:hypothetical protein